MQDRISRLNKKHHLFHVGFLAVVMALIWSWSVSMLIAQTYGCRDAILLEEFVYQSAPFPSCHAGTLAETPDGTLVAAWFGGYNEGHPRIGIWLSRYREGRWSPPVEVANGLQPDGKYMATWNPVLFQPKEGPLLLFFKVGSSPIPWWGEMMISQDQGKTWTQRHKLPDGGIGPVKNKPIQLADGTILCPSSTEENNEWIVHLEWTKDLGKTWSKSGPLHTKAEAEAIQPSILTYADGRMQLLCRNKDANGKLWQCWSDDGGKTWGTFEPTVLPNPNSGTDAVTLADGRQLLVYNHTNAKAESPDVPTGRRMLNVALSENGRDWSAVCILENTPGTEFSYPAVIQTRDGLVHILYTWQRKLMKHTVIDPQQIKAIPMPDGQWPR